MFFKKLREQGKKYILLLENESKPYLQKEEENMSLFIKKLEELMKIPKNNLKNNDDTTE